MKKHIAITLIIISFLFACNNKKTIKDEHAENEVEEAQLGDEYEKDDLQEEEEQSEEQTNFAIYSNYYYVLDIFEESKAYTPTEKEIQILKTPKKGYYSLLKTKFETQNSIKTELLAYVNTDSTDIRIFWLNLDDGEIVYHKEISQLKGENIYTFNFNYRTEILQLSAKDNDKESQYYKLEENREFKELYTPIIYNVQNGSMGETSLPEFSPVTLFSINRKEHTSSDDSVWKTTTAEKEVVEADGKAYDKVAMHNAAIDKAHFAIAGSKTLEILPDMQQIPYDEEIYGKLRRKLEKGMKEDATASLGIDPMEIYEIVHRGISYQIYYIATHYRYGKYNWYFATVNNNYHNCFSISAIPGETRTIIPFSLNDDLYIYYWYPWNDAENSSHEGESIDHLSKDICRTVTTRYSFDNND